MKNIYSILIMLLVTTSCSSIPNVMMPKEEVVKENIGIMPITTAGTISAAQGEIVYNAIAVYSYEIIKSKKLNLNLIERLDLDQIMEEFKLQDAGFTDPESLVELGKIKNLQKLIIPTFVFDVGVSKNHYVSLKLVDLKTGKTIAMSQDIMGNYGIDKSVRYIVHRAVYELYGFGYNIGWRMKMKRAGWF